MAQLTQLARPMMRRTASLHTNDTTRQSLEKLQQLCSLDCLVENYAAVLGNPVNLKDVLGQIKANCFNSHWAAPLLAVDNNRSMAHFGAGGAGAIHLIR